MEVLDSRDDKIMVVLDRTEAVAITNALNEVCNGIEVPEFSTRLGASRDAVMELLGRFSEALTAHGTREEPGGDAV